MNTKIGNFLLISDSPALNEKYERKIKDIGTGEFSQKSMGYHRNIKSACKALLEREMNVSRAENQAEPVKDVIDTQRSIVEAKKSVNLKKEVIKQ